MNDLAKYRACKREAKNMTNVIYKTDKEYNPWRVATVVWAVGEKNYQVYKFIHPGETDHAGNRKFIGGVFKTKEEAQALADKLNAIDAERG